MLDIPPELRGVLTTDVVTAGRVGYGIGRDASYRAVKSGHIPVLRIGSKLRVPVAELLRRVGVETNEGTPQHVAAQLDD